MIFLSTTSILKLSLLILFFLSPFSPAFSGETIPFIQEGNKKFNQAKYETAGQDYLKAGEAQPDNLPALLGLVSSLYQRERYPETARALKKAIRLSPRNITLYLWLANTIAAQENNSGAAEEFRREFRPRLIELWFEDDYRAAISDYQAIIAQYPESAWANYLLGSTYLRLNQKDKAGKFYREASRLAPDWAAPVARENQLGMTYNLIASLDHLNKFLQRLPESPLINFTRGALYQALELPKKARAAYETVLASGKPNRVLRAKTYLKLSRISVKNGDYRAALDQFNRTLALSPDFSLALFPFDIIRVIKTLDINPDQYRKQFQRHPENIYLAFFLAQLESEKNNYDEVIRIGREAIRKSIRPRNQLIISYWMISAAIKGGLTDKLLREYKSKIKQDPLNCENYIFLAFLHTRQARPDEAIEILENGRRRIPGATLLRARLASLYLKQGKYEKSIQEYRWLIDKTPFRLKYYGYLADCRFLTGATDQGKEVLDQLCRSFPREYNAWLTAGNTYRKNGQFSDAIKAYSSALELRPGGVIASLQLARIYIKTRQFSQAGMVYREAIKHCDRPKERRRFRKRLVQLYRDTGRLNELAREYEALLGSEE